MGFIEILKDLIPYRFTMSLEGETWGFEIRYNAEHDYFTIDLLKDDEVLVAGEKIVYGNPLFAGYADRKPAVTIVPFDLSDEASRAGWNEVGETVFLYLMDGDTDE